MAVSERLENYIWREIHSIYDEPTKEEKAFSAFKKEIQQEIVEIENEFRPLIEERLQKFNKAHNITSCGIYLDNNSYICSYPRGLCSDTELGKKADKAWSKRQKEMQEAYDNILLALELGGSKEELDRMLNELKEKVK